VFNKQSVEIADLKRLKF